jgi:large subunit ribosomal protein L9
MKVILLKDVAKIGKKSDLVEVPDGYALNQLIPKRMAEPATIVNMKRNKKLQETKKEINATEITRFETAKKLLLEKIIKIPTELNEQGHSFKAVSESDIADVAKSEDIDIDASMIVVEQPIKSAGEHVVDLVCGVNKTKFTVEVTKK